MYKLSLQYLKKSSKWNLNFANLPLKKKFLPVGYIEKPKPAFIIQGTEVDESALPKLCMHAHSVDWGISKSQLTLVNSM